MLKEFRSNLSLFSGKIVNDLKFAKRQNVWTYDSYEI